MIWFDKCEVHDDDPWRWYKNGIRGWKRLDLAVLFIQNKALLKQNKLDVYLYSSAKFKEVLWMKKSKTGSDLSTPAFPHTFNSPHSQPI